MKNPLSFSSVKLDLFSKDGVHLNTASGFVIEVNNQHYLITNWHVVSGKDISIHEQQLEITPYILKTTLHTTETHKWKNMEHAPVSWFWHRLTIQLYDNNNVPRWIALGANKQHPPSSDVVALRIHLDQTKGLQSHTTRMQVGENFIEGKYEIKISAISISAIDTDVEYGPSDTVQIIGYPRGWAPAGTDKASAAFWRTSWIASEMNEPGMIQANGFFIDPRAPEGMTGSPVVGMKNDRVKLLGIYSDRSKGEFSANAGLVWDARLVKELISLS